MLITKLKRPVKNRTFWERSKLFPVAGVAQNRIADKLFEGMAFRLGHRLRVTHQNQLMRLTRPLERGVNVEIVIGNEAHSLLETLAAWGNLRLGRIDLQHHTSEPLAKLRQNTTSDIDTPHRGKYRKMLGIGIAGGMTIVEEPDELAIEPDPVCRKARNLQSPQMIGKRPDLLARERLLIQLPGLLPSGIGG